MRIILIFIFTVTLFLQAFPQQKSFRINSVKGDTSGFLKSVFLYPEFIRGEVILKDRRIAPALLNYNRLSGQILFINSSGDTLEISTPGKVELITVATDTFCYFENSFLQLVTHYADGINLYKKPTIKYAGNEKKGAYGNYSNTTAANSLDKVSSGTKIENLQVDENALYVHTDNFYLRSPSGKFYPAVKKNFEKLFSGKAKRTAEYPDKSKIDYKNETDLIMLLSWLQS